MRAGRRRRLGEVKSPQSNPIKKNYATNIILSLFTPHIAHRFLKALKTGGDTSLMPHL